MSHRGGGVTGHGSSPSSLHYGRGCHPQGQSQRDQGIACCCRSADACRRALSSVVWLSRVPALYRPRCWIRCAGGRPQCRCACLFPTGLRLALCIPRDVPVLLSCWAAGPGHCVVFCGCPNACGKVDGTKQQRKCTAGLHRGRVALEGKGPQRRPQQRLDRRLGEVATAVGGGYCRLQMPLKLRLGALEGGGGGGYLPPFQCIPAQGVKSAAP